MTVMPLTATHAGHIAKALAVEGGHLGIGRGRPVALSAVRAVTG